MSFTLWWLYNWDDTRAALPPIDTYRLEPSCSHPTSDHPIQLSHTMTWADSVILAANLHQACCWAKHVSPVRAIGKEAEKRGEPSGRPRNSRQWSQSELYPMSLAHLLLLAGPGVQAKAAPLGLTACSLWDALTLELM